MKITSKLNRFPVKVEFPSGGDHFWPTFFVILCTFCDELSNIRSRKGVKVPDVSRHSGRWVAYERWSLMGTINEINPKRYRSTDNNYYIKSIPLLVKLGQIDKAVAIETNSFWVLPQGPDERDSSRRSVFPVR